MMCKPRRRLQPLEPGNPMEPGTPPRQGGDLLGREEEEFLSPTSLEERITNPENRKMN